MTHRAAEGAEAEGEEGEGVAQPMARRRAEGEEGGDESTPLLNPASQRGMNRKSKPKRAFSGLVGSKMSGIAPDTNSIN